LCTYTQTHIEPLIYHNLCTYTQTHIEPLIYHLKNEWLGSHVDILRPCGCGLQKLFTFFFYKKSCLLYEIDI